MYCTVFPMTAWRRRHALLVLGLLPALTLAQHAPHHEDPTGGAQPSSAACPAFLTLHQKSRGPAVAEQGIRVGRTFVPCRVECTDSTYTLRLGQTGSIHFPALRAARPTAGGRAFNRRSAHERVGIWFTRYPWGSLRKATMYDQGQAVRTVYYRPNGHFRRYLTVSANGKTLSEYDKTGRLVNALPHF